MSQPSENRLITSARYALCLLTLGSRAVHQTRSEMQ